MRVLLVDVPENLSGPVRERLGPQAHVDQLQADLLDTERWHGAGYDVIVHGLGHGADDQDRILRSTLGTWNLLQPMTKGRYVQLSSMQQFTGYDIGWDIHEKWLPRPATDATALAIHLGELTSLDLTRSRPVTSLALRLDEVVSADRFDAGPVQPTWIHEDDAVEAIVTAIRGEFPLDSILGSWLPLHGVRGDGRYQLGTLSDAGFTPTHTHPATDPVPVPHIPSLQPISGLPRPERITLYGAGGPLGAAATALLHDRTLVRASDIVALADLAQGPPQSPFAPLPVPLEPPHENLVVDITDGEQVRQAAVDADCLVNVSVVRENIPLAFKVNVLGAWHTMRAAIAEGVSKVVHTGPTLAIAPYPLGSRMDRRIDGTQDFRSGGWIYLLTKMLGQEICRLLAEEQQLACPVLLYNGFSPSEPSAGSAGARTADFAVTWNDSGRSILAAIDQDHFPEPSPVINIASPQPQDHWTTNRAKELIGWEAQDPIERRWWDPRVQP